MHPARSITAVLGGRRALGAEPANDRHWISRIHDGLPTAAAVALKDTLGLTNADLAALLGVSARTLARWTDDSRLDPVAGDRLYRAARLFAMALDVLGSEEPAVRWLRSPQRALGDAVPVELASTDVGARAVEALLGRMEHGVYT